MSSPTYVWRKLTPKQREDLMALLRGRRAALIAAVVMGKIPVPEIRTKT
jgi:hypothetical protein